MKPVRFAVLALALYSLIATAFAQAPANAPNPGKYGVTGWAINNQRVASQYNYYIDSTFQTAVGGTFTFPAKVCAATLNFGANRNVGAFNSNASVKIIDVNSSNTETVNGVTPSFSGGTCSLAFSTSNTHSAGSYILRSGTCGLREALNDLGGLGGEVIIDQRFYDDGCTASTITGLALSGTLLANQYVHDISNSQDTWYELKPLNNTAISAAGVALTGTGSAGGSLTNSGTYLLNYEYVDPLGGQGLANTESATVTLSSQNTITTSAPAAATGAVGWIPMITASGGSTGTEIAVPVTSAVCTLSTLTPYPTCAIGSVAVITANPSSTSKENVESFGHTSFGYLPIAGTPSVATASTWGDFQTNFLNFVAAGTLNNSNADVAQAIVPPQYFNRFGGVWDVCLRGTVTSDVTSSIWTIKLTMTNNYAQNPIAVSTVVMPTIALAAAGSWGGCFEITNGVAGTAGQFWGGSTGAWALVLNSTGLGTYSIDDTTALSASSNAPDLTKAIYLSVNIAGTGSANIVAPQVLAMTIKPVVNN
jgi:hypothetical protein